MGFVPGAILVGVVFFGMIVKATLNSGGDIISCALAAIVFLLFLAWLISLVSCAAT